MSKYYVYIIKNSANGKIYTGFTSDLEKRIKRHNGELPAKKKSFTYKNKGNGRWELIYKEEFSDYNRARLREKWLKSGVGRDWINKLVSDGANQ